MPIRVVPLPISIARPPCHPSVTLPVFLPRHGIPENHLPPTRAALDTDELGIPQQGLLPGSRTWPWTSALTPMRSSHSSQSPEESQWRPGARLAVMRPRKTAKPPLPLPLLLSPSWQLHHCPHAYLRPVLRVPDVSLSAYEETRWCGVRRMVVEGW